MANDSDLFNRWQAAQDYATRVLIGRAVAKASAPAERPPKPQALHRGARRRRLPTESLEPGYRAQFLTAAERERPRPHHRPRRRPAGHPQGAQGPAQGDRHAAARAPRRHLPRSTRLTGPYSPRRKPPAGGRCATRRWATWRAAARPRTSPASAAHFAASPQRRPTRWRARHAVGGALAGAGDGLRALLRALEGRPPRHRQLVRLPGGLPAAGDAGDRQAAHPPSRCSRSRTPTRCGP